MTTTLSSKGQVVLPKAARDKLRLRSGAKLLCRVRGESIVLIPQGIPASEPRIVRDPKSGLLVTLAPPDHPRITSDHVHAALAGFP